MKCGHVHINPFVVSVHVTCAFINLCKLVQLHLCCAFDVAAAIPSPNTCEMCTREADSDRTMPFLVCLVLIRRVSGWVSLCSLEVSGILVVVRMIKLQDHFLLTRRTELVGVKQDLHSLQASGKSHNVHL